ncbi:MAG: glutathione S-transferase N-terminal domain-containing protein [Thiotrichales bacterium]|nr:glutathione S-transferase N-terminal domain-containing protein [Thiotrichales bacterium]
MANRRSIMVLYSDQDGLLGHCTRLVLAEKDINVEINFVADDDRPEELAELNPYNSVLTLIDRDLVLYDAQIIMEYLDERFPHPPLLPVDPVNRATNRQLRYRVMRDLYSLIDDLEGENDIAAANARKSLRDNLTAIAPAFTQKPYFMSEEYTLVDCCMAPLMWRLPQYGVKLPASAKPLLEYSERLFEKEAFRESLSSHEKEIREDYFRNQTSITLS